MFKGILKSVKNRKAHYEELREVNSRLKIAIEEYLSMVFGNNVIKEKVRYEISIEKNNLLITTSSKAIATEIGLSLGELSRILKKEGLAIGTIRVA